MDTEQKPDRSPLEEQEPQTTPLTPEKSQKAKNPWRTSAIVLAIVILGLAGGLAFALLQLQQANNDIDELTTQRDSAREQLSTALRNQSTETPAPADDTETTATEFTSQKGVNVVVTSPTTDSTSLSSPLLIRGKIPGSWSQEGQFGILLRDSNGVTVASGTATLSGDWMTNNLVDFTASLTWETTLSGTYTLVLEKANPSDQAANADSVEIKFTLN